MNMRHWPVRLDKVQICLVLNCQPHDLSALMREALVVPLGNPASNGKKFFDTKAILALADDRKWLNKVTECIRRNWKNRNSNDETGSEDSRMAA
jgi:hypothetical protein